MSFSLANVTDSTGVLGSFVPQLASAVAAAGRLWQAHVAHDALIEVVINIARYTPEGIPGTAHALLSPQEYVSTTNGINLYWRSAVYELQTGVDANGSDPDIIITIDPTFLQNALWFDPTPETYDGDKPQNRLDAVSILMHEIGHALGFSGWRNWTTGELTGPNMLAYDQFVVRHDGLPWFTGPLARAVYGGDVPLTLGSPHHYGNQAGLPGSELVPNGLMNGISANFDGRAEISELDLAILQDMGLDTTWSYIGSATNDFLKVHLSGIVDGGAGLDTALFAGQRANFSVTTTGSELIVTNGSWQIDHVRNVERLQFSDSILAFDVSGNAGQVYRLYQAAFDRSPDLPGLSSNVELLDTELSLYQMSDAFSGSQEFLDLYGATDNSGFVTTLYRNVLDREPDAPGHAHWVNMINGGTLSRADVLIGFSESPENHNKVDPSILGGIHLDVDFFL